MPDIISFWSYLDYVIHSEESIFPYRWLALKIAEFWLEYGNLKLEEFKKLSLSSHLLQ